MELAKHAMEDADPEFVNKMQPGDFIVAGKNFGCGFLPGTRPHRAQGRGPRGVIAGSFARIFYRNAFNMGLAIFECPEAAAQIQAGQQISVDMDTGVITDLTTGKKYPQPGHPVLHAGTADRRRPHGLL